MGARESGGRRRLGWLRSTAVRRGISSILVPSCLALTAGPSASASVTPPSCDQAPYDIDGNSQIEALTDGRGADRGVRLALAGWPRSGGA